MEFREADKRVDGIEEKLDKPSCNTCANTGWETMDKVAFCNCCDEYEFYIPCQRN
jgi:hypothetical protein